MITFIVRRQEIDTLNLAISCKVNIQAPIPNIVDLFRMQPVLLLQFTGDLLAADMLELVVYLFARFIHPDGNDMYMMPCNIFVLVNHIRLVAVP